DGHAVDFNTPTAVEAGSTLSVGAARQAGCRAYLAVRGGIQVPTYMGSRATFTLGKFGGLGVLYGPHGAPDFFTDADIGTFFGSVWTVHYHSSRTGVRLIGPKPEWARSD